MKRIDLAVLSLLLLLQLAVGQEILKTQDERGLNVRFTFGSCFSERRLKQLNTTSIFEKINENKPDVFAWIGDFAYPKTFAQVIPAFNFTKNEKGYKMLQGNNVTSIIGVWDDHDYGKNDGDKNFKYKHEMRQIYLDYLDEAKNSIRRTQPGGIYTSYYLGKSKKVKLVLLDIRFSRDAFWFEHTDVLGLDQWKWLENEFKDQNSHTIILASGCQIIPDDRIVPERWYAKSRERLYKLIEEYKEQQRVLLISGDIHLSEIMTEPHSVSRFGYNIVEITSSGLTHQVLNYDFPTFFIDGFLPDTFNEKRHRFFGLNFALIDIEIDEENKENTKLNINIKDKDNETRLSYTFEPWKQDQQQLNLTSSKYTRKDHRYKRWIIWMFKNYFVEYRDIGIILTIIALVGAIFSGIIVKKFYSYIKQRGSNDIKQKQA